MNTLKLADHAMKLLEKSSFTFEGIFEVSYREEILENIFFVVLYHH